MVHFHATGSDVGSDSTELGMVQVQGFEFVPQTVKFGVAEFGLSEVVVEVRMMGDLLCQ